MSRSVVEMLRARSGRSVSPATCAALFVMFTSTLIAGVAFAVVRWGSVSRWPLVYSVALVVVSIGGSCSWWWINASVEGRILLTLSYNRGVAIADLLVVPALVLAAVLLVASVFPGIRKLV